jgi:cysteine desulfurase
MHFILKGGADMIYADNAATTRISDTAFEKMLPFLREQFGNASSQYSLGAKARQAIELARQSVANAIGAEAAEITFTSGGSESNSWVLRGVVESLKGKAIHIITSSIEHHSVLNACHALESEGVDITYLPVSRFGVVEIDSVIRAIRPDTKLVSIMLANNEIGTIQPIAEIGQFLREKDILFHTDAVQAVGHIPIDVNKLCVDFLSASAHKFNGAKGTGFLYSRSVSKLPQLIFGGKQEHGQRAGTENVAGVVALSFALNESLAEMVEVEERLKSMVALTAEGLRTSIPGIQINGEGVSRLSGTLNVTFPHASGEAMMHLLDLKGICVSTSSACNSGKDGPSHVLLALGLTEEQAKSSIRISYGRYNTIEDAETIVDNIRKASTKIEGAI